MHFSRISRKAVIVFALMFVGGCLAACKKKEEAPAPASVAAPAAQESDGAAGRESTTAAAPAKSPGASQGESIPRATRRKVIHNHSLNLQVKELAASLEALSKLAESSGGYVFKSNRYGRGEGDGWGEVGLRVPANRAGGVMTAIRGLGKVAQESSTAEDITEGYVDLEARLKNAQSSEARLAELYRNAGKLADVLEIEKELTRVRGDIEAFQAKKKNWDLLSEMATIEIRLDEGRGFPASGRVWTPIAEAFGKSIVVLANSVQSLIVFVGAVLPWLVVFGPLAYLYLKRRRKSRLTNPPVTKGRGEERIDSGDEIPHGD